jgi:hypothetical protein
LVQIFTAPEQSDAMTGPGGGGGGVPQGAQITFANHPVDVVEPSDVNRSVKQPVVDVTFCEVIVPFKVTSGAPVAVVPLYISR